MGLDLFSTYNLTRSIPPFSGLSTSFQLQNIESPMIYAILKVSLLSSSC